MGVACSPQGDGEEDVHDQLHVLTNSGDTAIVKGINITTEIDTVALATAMNEETSSCLQCFFHQYVESAEKV